MRSLLAVAGGLFFLASHASGQRTLEGTVVNGAGEPLGRAVVVLHGLSPEGGAELARDTADATGRFTLDVPGMGSALFFVATRIDGDLFVGPTFRDVVPDSYTLPAGAGVQPFPLAGASTGTPAMGGTATRAAGQTDSSSHGGWWVALIALVIAAVVALLGYRARRRPSHARQLMLDIARLDLEHGKASAGAAPATEHAYRTRRRELRERLDEAIALEGDAAGI